MIIQSVRVFGAPSADWGQTQEAPYVTPPPTVAWWALSLPTEHFQEPA